MTCELPTRIRKYFSPTEDWSGVFSLPQLVFKWHILISISKQLFVAGHLVSVKLIGEATACLVHSLGESHEFLGKPVSISTGISLNFPIWWNVAKDRQFSCNTFDGCKGYYFGHLYYCINSFLLSECGAEHVQLWNYIKCTSPLGRDGIYSQQCPGSRLLYKFCRNVFSQRCSGTQQKERWLHVISWGPLGKQLHGHRPKQKINTI